MEFAAVFALSAIVAILYTFIQPKVFAITSLQSVQANYFGKTLLTTVVIFATILIAGMIFGALDKRVSV
jgi:hypothetical protein